MQKEVVLTNISQRFTYKQTAQWVEVWQDKQNTGAQTGKTKQNSKHAGNNREAFFKLNKVEYSIDKYLYFKTQKLKGKKLLLII